jgi:hypothetical protein
MTYSVFRLYSVDEWMSGELYRMQEEADIVYLKYHPGFCLKGLSRTKEKLSGQPVSWLRFKLSTSPI